MSAPTGEAAEESHLLVDRSDGIMTLTMNRPAARNALSPQMLVRLAAAWHEFRDTDELRVAILTGAGEEDFCAGGDLKLTMPLVTGARQPEDEWDHRLMGDLQQFTDGILRGFELYKPIIAAVAGYALGGGCELAMLCDFIIAADTAKFGQPEITLGVIPGAGGTQRLTRFVGKSKAMDMVLTGRMMDAEEAERSGLVSRIVPADDLLEETLKAAEKIAEFSLPVVMMAKESVDRAYETTLSEGVRFERRVFQAMFALEDQKEGMTAFSEKRTPQFRNK